MHNTIQQHAVNANIMALESAIGSAMHLLNTINNNTNMDLTLGTMHLIQQDINTANILCNTIVALGAAYYATPKIA